MTNDVTPDEQPPANKKRRLVIALLALLFVVGIGVVVFLSMGPAAEPESDAQDAAKSDEAKLTQVQQIYIPLPQPFIFNVTSEKNKDFLVQIKVQLIVANATDEALVRQNLPRISHSLLTSFARATVKELRTGNGRAQVRDAATAAVQAEMEKVAGKPVVERVLFTGFVMQ